MKESVFQSRLIKEIKMKFPGCVVLKNDATLKPGIPDLLVLYKSHWAALECKNKKTASRRPNQEFYVNKLNDMSFASFVCPENKEEVLNAIQQAFRS